MKTTERIILCYFSFLFTRTKEASYLYLLVNFVFVAAILLLSTRPRIERSPHEKKQKNLDVLVNFCYGDVHQLCGRVGEDNVQS